MPQLNFNALAPSGPQGFYQGFEQGQKEKVTSEINQIKLEEVKRDRDEMVQLQEKLKGLGQDSDVRKYLDILAATGKPEYVKMAFDGRQKLDDIEAYAKLGVLQPDTASSTMPTGAPAPVNALPLASRAPGALGSGTFDPNAPMAAPAPAAVNALIPAPVATVAPATVNALAPQPNKDQIAPTQQRIRLLLDFARANPRMATQAMAEARILQDQLELYSRSGASQPAVSPLARLQAERAALPPNDPRRAEYDAAIRKESDFAPVPTPAPVKTISTVNPSDFTTASVQKFNTTGNYADLIPKPTTGGAGAGVPKAPSGYRTTATGELEPIPGGPAAGKPMTELQKQAYRKDFANDTSKIKSAIDTADELEKLTDELVGNPVKGVKPHPGLGGITGYTGMLPSLPTGEAAKAEQKLETFKGKIKALGRAIASQEGKLGNMAVQEWQMVSDAVQAIKPTAGNLDEQMRDVVRQARVLSKNMQDKFDLTYEGGAPAAGAAAPAAAAPAAGGKLSPAEQTELDALRKRFGK